MKNRSYFIILFTFLLLGLIRFAYADNIIGVSPADLRISNVLRGGYAEGYVTISLSSKNDVEMSIEPLGDIKKWLNFSEINYNVSTNKPWRLTIGINPPSDIPNGNYTGYLRVSSEVFNSNGTSNHAFGRVLTVIDVVITIEIVDKEILECSANNFEVKSGEKGDNIYFYLDVKNGGNVRLKPNIVANIWDGDQISIIKSINFTGDEILPTLSGKVVFKVPSSDMEVGQYWADLSVPECYDSTTLTFDVLEEGALRADGIITGINTKTWANIDETVPILVMFKNIGQKEIDSQFRGKISYGDEIYQVLESPVSLVSVGEINNFSFYFTPSKSGKYIISGRVYYSKKKTFESSSIVNVKPNNITLKHIILIVGYILIGLILFFLIYKIRKEKGKYLDELKRLRKNG
jgi:hypothetical protein